MSSSGPALLTWEQVQYADNDLVSVAQQVLTPGAWVAMVLAVASVAVLAGGRMAEQTRRVGQLKAAVVTPALVAAVLLAEHLFLAFVAAAVGLGIGGWPRRCCPAPAQACSACRARPRSHWAPSRWSSSWPSA